MSRNRPYIVFFILQAEKYGQFADNTAFVMAQEKDKNKIHIEKKKNKEVTYYRQGSQVSVNCSFFDLW